mmetsp:Transcript_22514/g.73858  ORF Transcript_22514/g.73858 Transcript_22514/m.73858 type:complete len:367 (-) Transcript_22514:147-1247(-)
MVYAVARPTSAKRCCGFLDLLLSDSRRRLCRNDLGGGVLGHVDALRLISLDLLEDPWCSLGQPVLERDTRSPSNNLLDEIVIAVTSAHSLRSGDVVDGQLPLTDSKRRSDVHGHVRHVVHRDHLVGSDVEGLLVVGSHHAVQSLNSIVDVAEASCLLAISPHLELLRSSKRLTQEGSWRLLASSLPGSVRTVDVVEAHDTELDLGVVDAVPPAAFLRGKFLKAVGILGMSWPGVLLTETRVCRIQLLVLRVDAGAGGVQETLHTILTSSLDHVEADHGVVVQDAGVVGLDEAHSSHVCGKVEHVVNVLGDLEAVLKIAEVHLVELVAELVLFEVLLLLPVGTDDRVPILLEPNSEVGPDEASGSAN